MKIIRGVTLSVVCVLVSFSAMAAPIESVDSSRSSAAFQKVDAFLSERAVADQLTSLGFSADEARARLATLNEAQLEQLAANVDLLKAGGKIQSAHLHPLGALGCAIWQVHVFFDHIIHFLFCWDDIR